MDGAEPVGGYLGEGVEDRLADLVQGREELLPFGLASDACGRDG
jgi:hypothetical protein